MRPAIETWREAHDTYAYKATPYDTKTAHDAAAAVIEADRAALVAEIVAWIKRDGARVASVTTPRMGGDNLAITLCTTFDNPDQENDEDTGWTPDAFEGSDETIAAITDFFAAAIQAKWGSHD